MGNILYVLLFFQLVGLPALFLGAQSRNITLTVGSDFELSCGTRGDFTWSRRKISENADYQEPKIIQTGPLLVLRSVRFTDSGVYLCTNKEGNVINETRILVGDSPGNPTNLTCVTHNSLTFTSCCWVEKKTGIATNFSLLYVMRTNEFPYWIRSNSQIGTETSGICTHNLGFSSSETPPRSLYCCQIPIGNLFSSILDLELEIQLKSENTLGVMTSKSIIEYPLNWIKPSPPTNPRLSVRKEGVHFRLTAKWLPPNMAIKSFKYVLRYRVSPDGNGSWHRIEEIFGEEKDLMLRNSYSTVEVQIAAQPTGRYRGHLSDWSVSAFNLTDVTAPTSSLRFDGIVSDISEDGLTITTNWIEYDRPDEPGFRYQLIFSSCNSEVVLSVNASGNGTSHRTSINYVDCVIIGGAYCNSAGCSKEASVKLHQSSAPELNSDVHLTIENKQMIVNWKSKTNVTNFHFCEVKIATVHRLRHNGSYYTVRKAIAHKKQNCDFGILKHVGTPSLCREYLAEVSAVREFEGVTYKRTNRSAIKKYSEANPVLRIQNAFQSSDRKLNVYWFESQVPICSPLWPTVLYKAFNGSECYGEAVSCETEYSVKANNCDDRGITISDKVYGDTFYRIRVAACCREEMSYYDDEPICYLTSHEKTVQTRIGAPSHIVNIQLNTFGKNLLTWDEPMHPNGPLTGYLITLQMDGEIQNFTTTDRQFNLDSICNDDVEELRVLAFTRLSSELVLYGQPSTLSAEACHGTASRNNPVPLIIGCAVAMSLVVSAAVLAYCNKRRIKDIIARTFWPSVPRPSVNVLFNTDEVCEYHVADDRNLNTNESHSYSNGDELERYEEIKAPLLSSADNPREGEVRNAKNHITQSDEEDGNQHDHAQRTRCPEYQQRLVYRLPLGTHSNTNEFFTERRIYGEKVLQFTNHQKPAEMVGLPRNDVCTTPAVPLYLSRSTTLPLFLSDQSNSEFGSTHAWTPDAYKVQLPEYTVLCP